MIVPAPIGWPGTPAQWQAKVSDLRSEYSRRTYAGTVSMCPKAIDSARTTTSRAAYWSSVAGTTGG